MKRLFKDFMSLVLWFVWMLAIGIFTHQKAAALADATILVCMTMVVVMHELAGVIGRLKLSISIVSPASMTVRTGEVAEK